MSKATKPWKITIGHGADALLAPAGARLAENFGGKCGRNGKFDGADCYLVQKSEDGEIAVLCLIGEGGPVVPLLGHSYKRVPKLPSNESRFSVIVDPKTHLPGAHRYTRYTGWLIISQRDQSLAWLILSEPAEMSRSQVKKLSDTTSPNSWPVDGLAARPASGSG